MNFLPAITDTLNYLISMISILNPIGALPVFLFLTRTYSPDEIKKIAKNCSLTIFITLAVSLVCGQYILGFFGISVLSFRIGGGILIARTALSMLRAEQSHEKMNQEEMDRQSQIREIGIVPLAIPLLAGPGAISTSIIQAERFNTWIHWSFALMGLSLICIFVYLILTHSRRIKEKIGSIGLNVMTRIMGLILLAIAIEILSSGLKKIFPILG